MPHENSMAQYLSTDVLDKEWLALTSNVPLTGQIPTPPSSDHGQSPYVDPSLPESLVTVSTVFYPGADLPFVQDVALLARDNVYFYVNTEKILKASYNGFNGLIKRNLARNVDVNQVDTVPVVNVDEPSDVLNIILHTIFEMSCAAYAPSFLTLSSAIHRMSMYGLQPSDHLAPSSPLFPLLLAQSPFHAIEVYALAAKYEVEALAVPVSSHLLSFPLFKLTDDLSAQIGPVYLRRLFFMHLGRVDALKRLLLSPPYPHPPTPQCDFTNQKNLSRAWSLAAAYIAWDSRPDTSNSIIKSAFSSLKDQISCEQCRQGLTKRLDEVIVSWSQVKCTI